MAEDLPKPPEKDNELEAPAIVHPTASAVAAKANGSFFDDVETLGTSSPEVQQWTVKAPRTLSSLGSSRASLRNGLLAMPVVGPGGTFRIRLQRVGPGLGSAAATAQESATSRQKMEALFQAHVDAGLATPASAPSQSLPSGVPALLTPCSGDAKVLLERCCKLPPDCLGEQGKEAFSLLGALFGAADSGRGKEREAMLRLSAWLARVNGQTVRQHLSRQSSTGGSVGGLRLLAPGPETSGDVDKRRLEAAFHHLTANSLRGALREVAAAAGSGPHFERLAAILASCGGASALGREQRRCLRQQLQEWRNQGVPELMGRELWRLYCVLAGELDEVIGDTLDWRTAFGLFLWYRGDTDEEDKMKSTGKDEGSASSDLAAALRAFQAAVRSHGSSCRFRPVPQYLAAAALPDASQPQASSRFSRGRDEPQDLQFIALQLAAGLLGPCNVALFDYTTHSSDPLDVALSWHFSVLLLALLEEKEAAAAAAGVAFQRLTQQYCQALELQNLREWAVYVAHFISDRRSRAALVRRLVLHHVKADLGLGAVTLPGQAGIAEIPKPHWPCMPPPLLWRARALRCEEARNWSGALACWLRCGEAQDRAVTIACGYLVGPTILGHASAPYQRGAAEAILLAAMNVPAQWLLSALEELEPAMGCRDVLWADVGREALAVLRHWSQTGQERFEPSKLVHLHVRCEQLRKGALGLPW
eukprot:TRINITY_DN65280_c0_g1_i1.p1 TRINITY_DN65280_c0_g1~~TRINITY_DN65280_c0_g1_i1.p1  ORF type:complete len:801 (-),score=188.21 TRINITY_DN65280_c0_g1_i1:71-2182(-)